MRNVKAVKDAGYPEGFRPTCDKDNPGGAGFCGEPADFVIRDTDEKTGLTLTRTRCAKHTPSKR